MNKGFFHDKTAVITGAGGTLCSAIARHLASQGTRVALLGRTAAPLEAVAVQIREAGGSALAIPCDVLDEAALEAARASVEAAFGTPWFLVNGAGGNQADAITTLTEFDPGELARDRPASVKGFFNLRSDAIESVVRTNTLGTMLPCQVFGRDMAAAGRGSMLTFGSMTSYRPISRVPAYATAKTGIVSFTSWLAAYLAPAGIRVNGIAPGFFVNERSRKILQNPDGSLSARGKSVVQHTPLRRFGEAQELLGTVDWLLDDERAGFVTGVMVPVDGGFLSCPGI